MDTTQKLYRARKGKVLGGVCGGLGDYMGIDKVIVRILFILLAIFGGSGVLVYIILWIAIPEQNAASVYQMKETAETEGATVESAGMATNNKLNNSMVVGIIMVAIGLLFLLNSLLPMYNLWNFWPVVLIAAGVLLISPELIKPSK